MASQTFMLPAVSYVGNSNIPTGATRGWVTGFAIDNDLSDSTNNTLLQVYVDRVGFTAGAYTYNLFIRCSRDLSTTFEENGEFVISVGSASATIPADESNSNGHYVLESTALGPVFDAMSETRGETGGTLTIDDEGGGGDTTAPAISGTPATNTAGTVITIGFDEALDTGSEPAVTAFTTSPTKTIADVSISGTDLLLTVSPAFANGDTITVSYTTPNANPLQDAAGNDVADFSAQSVTNNVPVGPAPLSATITGPASVQVGDTPTFSVTVAGGTGAITRQWEYRYGGTGAWTDGGTGASYQLPEIPAAQADETLEVRCVVDRGGASATSNTISRQVQAADAQLAAVITGPATVQVGNTPRFSVTVTGGTGTVSRQWQYRYRETGAWTNGGTGTSYTLPAIPASEANQVLEVRCNVDRGVDSVTSNTVTRQVAAAGPPPVPPVTGGVWPTSGTLQVQPAGFPSPVNLASHEDDAADVDMTGEWNVQESGNLGTIVQAIETLETRVEEAEDVDGNTVLSTLARWLVKTQVGDLVGGVGLLNDGSAVRFYITADRFAIIPPGVTDTDDVRLPFVVSGGEVFINSAVIANASIGALKAENAFLTNLTAVHGTLDTARIAKANIFDLAIGNSIQSDDYSAGTRVSATKARATVGGVLFVHDNTGALGNGYDIRMVSERAGGTAVSATVESGRLTITLRSTATTGSVSFSRSAIATAVNASRAPVTASGTGNLSVDFSFGGGTVTPGALSASISGPASIAVGDTPAFSVTVTGGSGTIGRQWQYRYGGSGAFTNGGTGTSYTLPAVPSAQSGETLEVRCNVTRGTASATSNTLSRTIGSAAVPIPAGVAISTATGSITASSTTDAYYMTAQYDDNSSFSSPGSVYDTVSSIVHSATMPSSARTGTVYARARFTTGVNDGGTQGEWSSTVSADFSTPVVIPKPVNLSLFGNGILRVDDPGDTNYYATFEYADNSSFTGSSEIYDSFVSDFHGATIPAADRTGTVYARARFTTAASDGGTQGPWSDTVSHNFTAVAAAARQTINAGRASREGTFTNAGGSYRSRSFQRFGSVVLDTAFGPGALRSVICGSIPRAVLVSRSLPGLIRYRLPSELGAR